MPIYLADYAEELKAIGTERFLRKYPHPVLIVAGISGKLKDESTRGGTTIVAESSDMMLLGSLVGRVFPLVKGQYAAPGPGPVSVGRTSDNDVAIPEYSISKRHCFLAVVGNEVRVTDVGSTNGTQVNGVALEPKKPRALAGGETLTLGRFALLFHLPRGFREYLQSL